MTSLAAMLERHRSILVLDASSRVVHAGWLHVGESPQWQSVEEEAGTGLHVVLDRLKVSPNEASAFVYGEGPGSILGIRITAAAIRTWIALNPRPVYNFRSLELLALSHGKPGDTFICDARRRSWHALTLGEQGELGQMVRTPTSGLPASRLFMPAGFRCWTEMPEPPPVEVPYDPVKLGSVLADASLLRLTEDPDAYRPEGPTYRTWSPQVHQAPPPKTA